MDDLLRTVTRTLSPEANATFDRRVAEQAADLRAAIGEGEFDSADFAIGLELELYAVDADGRLTRVPDEVFAAGDCGREIGLHNVELNADPQPFSPDGIEAQATELRRSVEAVDRRLASTGARLVFDGMWTVPPAGGSREYLGAVETEDGLTVAENMPSDPRYCGMDNVLLHHADGEIEIDVPGATHRFPTILVESLTTSIQPHLQIPDAEAFPAYFNAAIRTLGPVLALATNSPFLPGDLYTDVADPHRLVERTPHELRVPVFEQTVNVGDHTKACCPNDIESPTDIVDQVVADWTCSPFLREWTVGSKADDRAEAVDPYWEFSHKYGTYWRWVRSIIGGDATGPGGSIRIEYRPLPTQPTVEDVLSLHWLTTGLLCGIVAADHPLCDVAWVDACAGFYNAVEDGLDAELFWRTADGEPTSDPETIYPELFGLARRGLCERGVTESDAEALLAPMRRRWERRRTPSRWKKARVREQLDVGKSLAEAIAAMQAAYNRHSERGDPFADW